jgi:hypothetical protein
VRESTLCCIAVGVGIVAWVATSASDHPPVRRVTCVTQARDLTTKQPSALRDGRGRPDTSVGRSFPVPADATETNGSLKIVCGVGGRRTVLHIRLSDFCERDGRQRSTR